MSCHTSGNVIVRHRVLANELATLLKRTSGTGDGIIAFRPTEGVGERLLFGRPGRLSGSFTCNLREVAIMAVNFRKDI